MSLPLNLKAWIKENRHALVPPVSNKQLFTGSDDVIVFVSGGPNTRNDFHVNPTEELFYQLKGDIAVRLRPLDGSEPFDQVIREGELFLLPRHVPHRPQRPAGTVGLIVEFPRPAGQLDGLRWYCPKCGHLVHEAQWQLRKIDEDLKIIMEDFWGGPEGRRTCRQCQHVIERAGAISLREGRVTGANVGTRRKLPAKAVKVRARAEAKVGVKGGATARNPRTTKAHATPAAPQVGRASKAGAGKVNFKQSTRNEVAGRVGTGNGRANGRANRGGRS